MRVKGALLFLGLLLHGVTAFAETVDGLFFVESSGTSLLKIAAGDPEKPTFLWDQDPLSSGWLFSIEGKSYSPADAGWLREEKQIDGSYRLAYSNRVYSVEQTLSVLPGQRNALIELQITNNSDTNVVVKPALLVDTSIGEVTGVPFHLSDGTNVVAENEFTGSGIPSWLRSVRNSTGPSLYLHFDADKVDRPNRIVMANWLRLKQDGPDIDVDKERDFDYLPFSENDSAVLVEYSEKRLASGSSTAIRVLMGLDSTVPEDIDDRPEELPGVAVESENIRLREFTLKERIRGIDGVIEAIDGLLNNESAIDAENITRIEEDLLDQEQLREEYENL